VRRACREHGQLAVERDVLLSHQADAVREHGPGLARRAAHPDTPAVIAAADRLQHHRPDPGGERLELGDPGHRREPGTPDAQGGQPLPHGQLVLGQAQRRGGGPDRHAGLLERGQVLARHVLVVEGEHVALGGEVPQVVPRAVVPDLSPSGDLGGAVGGRAGQDTEADAQADGRLSGHPGQLAGAHHADHGHVCGVGHALYPTGPASTQVAGREHHVPFRIKGLFS